MHYGNMVKWAYPQPSEEDEETDTDTDHSPMDASEGDDEEEGDEAEGDHSPTDASEGDEAEGDESEYPPSDESKDGDSGGKTEVSEVDISAIDHHKVEKQQAENSIAEEFQNAWISEMEKIKSNTTTQPLNPPAATAFAATANETEAEAAKLHAAEWYEAMCEAVKIAAKKVLPRKAAMTPIQRQVSQHTKELFAEKKRLQQLYRHQRTKHTKQIFKDIQRKIRSSCLDDYKVWLEKTVKEMEIANTAGDIKKIYRLVKSVSNKPGKPTTNLTTDKNGQLLQSPKLVADTWKEFLSNKFKATDEEHCFR